MTKFKLIILAVAGSFAFGELTHAQGKAGSVLNRGAQPSGQLPNKGAPGTAQARPQLSGPRQKIIEVSNMIGSGQYAQAALKIHDYMRTPEMSASMNQLRYLLGFCLAELGYHQLAAFQFVHVVKSNATENLKQALERLSISADYLGDDTLLNYAINKIQVNDFPAAFQDALYFRLGEIKQKNAEFDLAMTYFAKVAQNSKYRDQARFKLGLTLLEANRPLDAVKIYEAVLRQKQDAPVTDVNRVATILALARSYYQAQKWDEAIEYYRMVPRDTEMWHDAMFEMSWAYLRGARFRSALSNFQTIHSTYYEDFYIPESLLLRSLVYLYICKYDDMEKVLDLFDTSYGKVRSSVMKLVNDVKDPIFFYEEIEKAQDLRKNKNKKINISIPYVVAKKILDEGDISRALRYTRLVQSEKARFEKSILNRSKSFSSYARNILETRLKNIKMTIGGLVRDHLLYIQTELGDLSEQASFARYEMTNGRKEQLKKRIAGKVAVQQIDEDKKREFYVQNGYEYWPFQGEYWLDELGSYQYLGKQNCE